MAKERRKAICLPIVAARGLAAAVSIMMVLGSLRVMILGVMCVAAIVCTNSDSLRPTTTTTPTPNFGDVLLIAAERLQ